MRTTPKRVSLSLGALMGYLEWVSLPGFLKEKVYLGPFLGPTGH